MATSTPWRVVVHLRAGGTLRLTCIDTRQTISKSLDGAIKTGGTATLRTARHSTTTVVGGEIAAYSLEPK